MSPKGKFPWITLNGVDIPDTEFCMKAIRSHFKKPVDYGGDSYKEAQAHVLQRMTDEAFFW